MACASKRRCVAALTALTVGAISPLPSLATGAPGGALAAEPGLTIVLRPHVTVTQEQVTLGDVAYLTSRSLPLLRRLMALPIGHAPRPGASASLDRETVARWVEARTGLPSGAAGSMPSTSAVRWLGADEIEIDSASQQLSGETVTLAAREALLAWLVARGARAEVQAVSSAADLVLPTGGAPTLRVRPLARQAPLARRVLVWVDIWVGGRFARSTAVRFEVDAWGPGSMAAVQLDRGALLDPVVTQGAMVAREVDLVAIPGAAPVANGASGPATGLQRLRRPLRSGEVLTEDHLELAPAVVRGTWAQLQARSGEVSIQSRVEVLQDGRLGQMVRVKVPGASAAMFARVTGQGAVEAQP